MRVRSSDQGTAIIAPATGLILHGAPGDGAIHLTWTVTGTPPLTTTWQVGYESETGTLLMPPINIPTAAVRAHTLVSLTNYMWYTVTLSAMADNTPWLTDSVRVMPTDQLLYLPLVLKN